MITANQLIIKVAELALRNPKFIYTSGRIVGSRCLYRPDEAANTPACIFGQALTELGVNLDEVKEGISIRVVCNKLGIDITYDQGDWMSTMQHNQDADIAWGICLVKANFRQPDVLRLALTNL